MKCDYCGEYAEQCHNCKHYKQEMSGRTWHLNGYCEELSDNRKCEFVSVNETKVKTI